MDIRIMEYFLAVTREGNISAAAQSLHISQPALSKQISDLEKELGVKLFDRGSRRITLTEEGMILKKRSEEMVSLLQRTQNEIHESHKEITGDINIGAGEAVGFHYISEKAAELIKQYPGIRLHVVSGDTEDLMDQLENGLVDMALLYTDFDRTVYNYLSLPKEEKFGVLMRPDSPLASQKTVHITDLYNQPVILSRAAKFPSSEIDKLKLHVVATYNLAYNASLMVEDGIGYAVLFDGLINTSRNSNLTFRPLSPDLSSQGYLIWKKYVIYPAPVRLLLDRLTALMRH